MSLAYKLYKEGTPLHGRYEKVEDISEGAYGIVSLARDNTTSNLVAVKYIFKFQDEKSPTKDSQFSKSLTAVTEKMDEDICEEALHEIDIHQKLGTSHPSIISLIDCFDSFIILEYCPRGDLYEAIKANMGPTSTTDIVNVMLQLVDAVEFAHSRSIYHRDIKPENILIAKDFTIRLSDWGLASSHKMCTEFGVGSERYMAPELFDEENVQVYDASKCDIWSIGICLLNIVFHKSPFSAANQTDKSFSYFVYNREALFDIFSSMSDDLFSVLRHSLTLDPENRSLSKMKEELLKAQRFTFDDELDLVMENDISEATDVKPISIATGGRPYSGHGAGRHAQRPHPKSFAVPTPNTHIANHFHEFKRDDYNRSDFFTPPSVSAHYMEKFAADRPNRRPGVYQPPHQRPSTPKTSLGSVLNSLNGNNVPILAPGPRGSRKNSFNSFSSSVGKYIPPKLRASPINGMKSPLHESTHVDDIDSDDDLFVLEEADSRTESEINLSQLGDSIATLNVEDYSSELSSAPSLIVSAPLRTDRDKATSNTIHDRKHLIASDTKVIPSHDGDTDSISSGSNSESNTKRTVYVPPHHRENYNSHWNHNPHNRKPSFWNHKSHYLNNHSNNSNNHNGGYHHSGARRMSANKRQAISSSAPAKKTDWFPPSRVELYEDDVIDDDDFEKSEFYQNFAGRVGEHSDPSFTTEGNDRKDKMIRESVQEVTPVVE